MKIDIIEFVSEFKICQIRENTDGKFHRRTIKSNTDISSEPPAVKNACLKAWTDEVKEAYRAHQESSNPANPQGV